MSGSFVPIWIPTSFTAILIFFFIAAFFMAPSMSAGQLKILRFLAALCGAISAFMWTGEALLNARGKVGGWEIAFSGTAGFAIFFLVWVFWERAAESGIGFNYSVGSGWTFANAAGEIANAAGGNLVLNGFSEEEKAAALRQERVFGADATQALVKLRNLAPGGFPAYNVEKKESDFELTVRR
jgi:hypothetical protein